MKSEPNATRTGLPKEVAEAYADGRSIIPMGADKKPAMSAWKQLQKRLPTRAELATWAAQTPAAWAQVCGEFSGVITLDFDGEAGRRSMEEMGLEPHRRTGSGGYHVDFEWPGFRVPTLNGKAKADLARRWPGLDVRGDGGCAIIWGRSHKGEYVWLRDLVPHPAEALPADIRKYLDTDAAAQPEPSSLETIGGMDDALRQAVAAAGAVGRNNAGFDLMCLARDEGLNRDEAEMLLRRFRDQVGARNVKGQIEAYTDGEIRATLDQVFSRPPRSGRPATASKFPWSDSGNGELLAALYDGLLKYDHKRGRWLIREQHWWRPDLQERRIQYAKAAARVRQHETISSNAHDREGELKWALKSEDHARIQAALQLARSERGISDDGEGWDGDPWLLGVQNGILDLHTGCLRHGQPEDKITRVASVSFDPDADCPVFEAFLERVQPDLEMREYLRRRAGYALTGGVGPQDILLFIGRGANGKTTFVNVLMDTLGGDSAVQAAPGLIVSHFGDRHPTEIADIDGARLVVSSELDEGRSISEALVKQLTGGKKARLCKYCFRAFSTGEARTKQCGRPKCRPFDQNEHSVHVNDAGRVLEASHQLVTSLSAVEEFSRFGIPLLWGVHS